VTVLVQYMLALWKQSEGKGACILHMLRLNFVWIQSNLLDIVL